MSDNISMNIDWSIINQVRIVQPPLQQEHKGCMYAAVAKHIDSELRIQFAKRLITLSRLPDCFVCHKKMELSYKATKPRHHQMSSLLAHLENEGIPLVNSHTLGLLEIKQFSPPSYVTSEERVTMLLDYLASWLKDGTVVGTMVIYKDYPKDASRVYKALDTSKSYGNHSVCILGLLEVKTQTMLDVYGCSEEGTYIIYQESRGVKEGEDIHMNGFLGFGRTLAHPRVLLKIYQVVLENNVPLFLREN